MTEPVASLFGGPPAVRVRAVRGQDGSSVILSLDPQMELDRLRAEILRVLGQTPERWRHATTRLDLGDRDLELFDVRRLVHLLRDELAMSVVAIYSSPRAVHRFVARELKLQVLVRDPAEDQGDEELAGPTVGLSTEDEPTRPAGEVDVVVLDEVGDYEDSPGATAVTRQTERVLLSEDAPTLVVVDPSSAELVEGDGPTTPEDPAEPVSLPVQPAPLSLAGGRRSMSIGRTLRGGQRVSFAGDVIVFGDVNPGATIEAGGNILVLGSLRGLAHAGMHGDSRAVIIAFELRPTQLRIAGCIAFPGEGRSARGFQPELAWVQGDRIAIEDYTGRLPGPLSAADPAESPRRDL